MARGFGRKERTRPRKKDASKSPKPTKDKEDDVSASSSPAEQFTRLAELEDEAPDIGLLPQILMLFVDFLVYMPCAIVRHWLYCVPMTLLFGWQGWGRPSADRVIAEGPPRVFLSDDAQARAARALKGSDCGKNVDVAALNKRVVAAVRASLASARQVGIVVVAYYKGYEIVHVGGGLCRAGVDGRRAALD